MPNKCFNCKGTIEDNKPICPNCYTIQSNRFSREDLFKFLEIYFPIKPDKHEKITSTKVEVAILDYDKWLIIGILTLGLGYYYYLLRSLKALNDHWYYPHHSYEKNTSIDMFVTSIFLLSFSFIGVPFIQYVRYEKFRKHLEKLYAYDELELELPIKGSIVFWGYFIFNLLFLGSYTMFILGGLAYFAGMVFVFDSTFFTIIFFIAAILILVAGNIMAIRLVSIERQWQELFNKHILWHLDEIKNK